MLTRFIFVSTRLPQLEQTPGNTKTSSSEISCGVTPSGACFVSLCKDAASSGDMRPSCTFCSSVRGYVRRFHFGSLMSPMNSMNELPAGSSSLRVNGCIGFSASLAFPTTTSPDSSSSSPRMARKFVSSSSILL